MTDTTLAFTHRFEPAAAAGGPPLLLLHGTGGDETDLLPLGRMLAPGAALLSPRGKVLEGGMPRFFRRLAEGVFDPTEVRTRADELADFIATARIRYGLAAPVVVGFSNGANVAAVILARRPGLLAGGILLRPMLVLDEPAAPAPAGIRALLLSGTADPIVPPGSAERLAALLAAGGTTVEHRRLAAGHNLTREDVTIATAWLGTDPSA